MRKFGIRILVVTMFLMFAMLSNAEIVSNVTTTLNWDNPTTNCDNSTLIDRNGTYVYLTSVPTGSYTRIATLPVTATLFADSFAVPNNIIVQRCYMVRAFDATGNESCNDSNQVCRSFFGVDTIGPAGIINLR
jgi:hypothetical protein